MASRRRVTVEQWLGEALQDPDKGKPCTAIALVLAKGIGTEEIHSRIIEGPQDHRQLAAFFVNKATAYSQDLAGIQTFKLLAFYGQTEPQASFPFTVVEGELTAGEQMPFSRHESTEKGALGLTLKALESSLSMNMQIVQTMAAHSLQRDQEIQRERNEMNIVMRDMLLSLRKEGHEMRIKELEFARSSEERKMIGKAIPSVINHLTGREVVPETYADSELVDALALQVTPEDLQMLVSIGKIKPEIAALLAQRFMKTREETEKRKQTMRALPSEEDSDIVAELNGKGPEKEHLQ
jgi:hypothetical protein